MKNRGCNNCKHHQQRNGLDKPNICAKGHATTLIRWWIANGARPSDLATIEDPACFEQTALSKQLDKMIAITQEIIQKLKKE